MNTATSQNTRQNPVGTDMTLVTSTWSPARPADTPNRFAVAPRFSLPSDETVVVDERCGLSPSQAVENRLVDLLRGASLPVSHLQARSLSRGRCDD